MLRIAKALVLVCFLVSCASLQEEDKYRVGILLNPKFAITLGLNDSKPPQSQLLDNDGNVYITYWDVASDGYKEFQSHIKMCEESIRDKRLFLSAFSIHDYNVNEIEPALYALNVKCMIEAGYKNLGSEAFSPRYFELSFYRTHSTSNSYLPVGSKYRLKKQGAQYIEAYNDTLECENQVVSSGNGLKETFSYSYIRVSIENYVEEFQICLKSKGYEVERYSYIFS